MTGKIDKVTLTNLGALKHKYGAKGVAKITASVGALIAADKRRGLSTRLIGLDDKAAMKKLSASPVTNSTDPKANKVAVDGVYRALAPDYILLLGSIDVIPHQDLKNPLYTGSTGADPDEFAYGDLPYACDAPYSQAPQDFFGPVRVVGRLPDITGADDPSYLVDLLSTAAGYIAVKRGVLDKYFAVTAQIWEASSKLSVTNTFGQASALADVPPNSSNWPAPSLAQPMHFFNCHGASLSSQFYGQPADGRQDYPVALDAAYVDGKIQRGTIAAAECCYGGELYGLSSAQSQVGMCNTYLGNKSYGFFASTTIAYGPSDGNGQADLICQYFLQSVLAGASLGRAALQARQKLVRTASPPDPSDVKTLAEFNLYGDPSITAVAADTDAMSPAATKSTLRFIAERAERHDRRRLLFNVGIALQQEPKIQRSRSPAKTALRTLRARARILGFEPGEGISFAVRYETKPKSLPQRLIERSNTTSGYHVLFVKETGREERAAPESRVHRITLLIGKEVDGAIVSISKVVSR
jgi:hypothetical protein